MTLYHLTPEGSGVILSYQPASRRRRGGMEDESREEQERDGTQATLVSATEISSALEKRSFDHHLLSKLLKNGFAFLSWTEQTA